MNGVHGASPISGHSHSFDITRDVFAGQTVRSDDCCVAGR